MKNTITNTLLLLILCFLASCSNNAKNNISIAINNSLKRSNNFYFGLSKYSLNKVARLERKNPAFFYYDMEPRIKKLTDDLIDSIEKEKQKTIELAGRSLFKDKSKDKYLNRLHRKISFSESRTKELDKMFYEYKQSLEDIISDSIDVNSQFLIREPFSTLYYKNISYLVSQSLLTKTQNDIYIFGAELFHAIRDKVRALQPSYDRYLPIAHVTTGRQYVKINEKIEFEILIAAYCPKCTYDVFLENKMLESKGGIATYNGYTGRKGEYRKEGKIIEINKIKGLSLQYDFILAYEVY